MAHHSSQEQAVRFFTGRPHVGIPHGPLRVLAAWRGDAIRARGDYRYHLNRAELAEIDAGLAHAMATAKPTIDLDGARPAVADAGEAIGQLARRTARGSRLRRHLGRAGAPLVAGGIGALLLGVRSAPRHSRAAESARRPARPRHRHRRRRNGPAGAPVPHRQQHQLSLRRRRCRRLAVPERDANGRAQPHREFGDGVQRAMAQESEAGGAPVRIRQARSAQRGKSRVNPLTR